MLNLTEGVERRPPPSLLRIFAKLGGWPKYYEENIDGQLWLNPGSCGRKRFNLPITMAGFIMYDVFIISSSVNIVSEVTILIKIIA